MAGQHTLSPADDPMLWPAVERDRVLDLLTKSYADILAMDVACNGHIHSMRWELIKIVETYGDPAIEPDAEHCFLAFLVEEGMFKDLVTTNWDPLVERADISMHPNAAARVRAVACNEELDTAGHLAQASLFKIHGCALKSAQDGPKYKPFIVATSDELTLWTTDANRAPFRDLVKTQLRQRSVVFIGISGHDNNLQVAIVEAILSRTVFDAASPRIFFCEPSLTPIHSRILRAMYGPDAYTLHSANINQASMIPLFGKPILGALSLAVLLGKFRLVLELGREDFREPTRNSLDDWIAEFRLCILAFLERSHDTSNPANSWRTHCAEMVSFLAWCASIYRNQVRPSSLSEYSAFLPGSLLEHRQNPNTRLLGYHWCAWTSLVMLAGNRAGLWTIDINPPSRNAGHPLRLSTNGVVFHVFLVASTPESFARLLSFEQVDPQGPRTAIIYPFGYEPRRNTRSPSRRLPTSNDDTHVEIWMRDLYNESHTDDDVLANLHTVLV